MNGVEYYRDRRVDRSQYKGLSFRLRDPGCLELARLLCAAPPRAVSGAAAPTRASTIRQSSVDRTGTQLRTPRAIAATIVPAMCNDGIAHVRKSGIRTKQRRSLSSVNARAPNATVN